MRWSILGSRPYEDDADKNSRPTGDSQRDQAISVFSALAAVGAIAGGCVLAVPVLNPSATYAFSSSAFELCGILLGVVLWLVMIGLDWWASRSVSDEHARESLDHRGQLNHVDWPLACDAEKVRRVIAGAPGLGLKDLGNSRLWPRAALELLSGDSESRVLAIRTGYVRRGRLLTLCRSDRDESVRRAAWEMVTRSGFRPREAHWLVSSEYADVVEWVVDTDLVPTADLCLRCAGSRQEGGDLRERAYRTRRSETIGLLRQHAHDLWRERRRSRWDTWVLRAYSVPPLRRLRGTWARMRVMRQRRAMLVRLTRHVDTTTSEKAKRLLRPDRHPDVIYPIEEPTDASLEGQAVSAPIGKRQCTTAPLRPQERGPEKLGPDEQRYYLSLCGAAGGLTTWAISSLAVRFVRVSQERYWMLEGAYLALAVVTISVVCSVLNARWNARLGRTPWRWQSLASVWAASFMTAGCCNTGFILARWLYAHHISPAEQIRACILAWAVTGAMVGASVSCWTHGLQPFRFLFSTLGGLMGGLVGGVLRACLLGVAPQWANALALTITGFAISLGSSVTILLVRKARIRLVSSRYVPGQREWEFARGDRVIIGHVPPGKQRIQLPDPNLAPAHAEILEQDGKLVIRPHVDNREPDGRPRLPIYVDDKELVDKSAPLGKESRVRVGDTTLEIVVASVAAAVLLSAQEAHATELGQLVATSKPRLVCCDVGSERPCFDAELAARGNRDPAGLRFPNREAARQAVTVKNGQEQTLETVWVIPNVAAEIQQQRYAFLLLDRSGSMKEPAGEGRSKFDVMKEAASTFLNGFEPGIDHVAIAPFSSRAVAKTIEDAPFTDDVETAREIVRSLPDPAGNTGLYSATLAALAVIDQARRQSAVEHADPPVVLLVVMTDGKNDVGHNDDDPDLLTGLDPVLERNRELNVPIVTIGFGSEDSVDRPSLARLAWPNAANSKFAATGAELHVAFRAARSTMVDRFRIRFKALEATRAQLTSQKFLIAANSMAGEHFEGRIDWTLPYLGQAPFEACPPPPGPGPEIGSAAVSQVEQNRAHSRERARPLAIWWMDYLTTLLVLASPIALAWHALPRLPGHPFIAWRNDRLRVRLHTSIRSARSKSRTVRKAVAERHAASRQ